MSNQLEKVKELIALRAQARLGGGEKAIEKQHAKGKYTARERIGMKAVSRNWTCLSSIVVPISVWTRSTIWATVW